MVPTAVDEVVGFTSDPIRIDTTNTGDPSTVVGERAAAEYVAERLAEVGYETTYVESGAPGSGASGSGGSRRGNVIARLPGSDPSRPALLVHGHLDVVPFEASDWSVHPFGRGLGPDRRGDLGGRPGARGRHARRAGPAGRGDPA